MSPELNIEAVFAILLDVKQTRDWFFACRNIPSRMLRNRWQSAGDSARMEALYLAHGQLSPNTNLQLRGMSPNMYREEYARILDEYRAANADIGGVKQYGIDDLRDVGIRDEELEMERRQQNRRGYQNHNRPMYDDYEPGSYQAQRQRRPRYDDGADHGVMGQRRPRYDDRDPRNQGYQDRGPKYVENHGQDHWRSRTRYEDRRQPRYDDRDRRRPRYDNDDDDDYFQDNRRSRYGGVDSDSSRGRDFSVLKKKESLDDLMKDN